MKIKFSKSTLIAALISGIWLCVTLFVLNLCGVSIGWPAFMPFVLFNLTGWKTSEVKSIFLGGGAGLLLGGIALKGIFLIIGRTGIFYTYLIPIFIAIFLLVALGDVIPVLFNNYTFCFYTIAFATPEQETLKWILIMLLGGGFYFGGMLMFIKLFIKPEPPSSEGLKEEAA